MTKSNLKKIKEMNSLLSRLFDKNNNIMQNGEKLLGEAQPGSDLDNFYISANFCEGNRTTQGTMILPKPNTNNYYVFSQVNARYSDCTDAIGNGNNPAYFNFDLRYAEVSMDNGLGTVISKGSLIGGNSSLSTALSADGSFYWLITSKNGSLECKVNLHIV